MSSNRRQFIEQLGATAVLGALPLGSIRPAELLAMSAPPAGDEVDLTWVAKLKGKKHKVLADCVFPESGIGVWRAFMWEAQYQGVLGAKPAECQTVLVLRHDAAVLALKQELWDTYDIGNSSRITHPITQAGTQRNPTVMTAADGLPDMVAAWNLPNFIAKGGIVLACSVALRFWSANVAQKDHVSDDEAFKRTMAGLQPGVLAQPSGVFAAVKAQEEGCVYLRAS